MRRRNGSLPAVWSWGLGGQAGGIAALNSALDASVPPERRRLAALGPRKFELAREPFGRAVTLLVGPGYTAWARDRLGGGRTLVVDQMVVLDEDPQAARAAAREPLGFLCRVGGYAAAFSRMGLSDTDISEMSDGLVDATFAWGGIDRVVARPREQEAAGATHVVIALLCGPGELETAERLAPSLQEP